MPTKNSKTKKAEENEEDVPPVGVAAASKLNDDSDDDSSSSSDDEDEDDLVLEGVLVRNPDASDSDDTSSEESDGDDNDNDDDDDDDGEEEETMKPPAAKKAKSNLSSSTANKKNDQGKNDKSKQQEKVKKAKKKKAKQEGPDIIDVEFTFCDMNEKFFQGLKTLLNASSPVFAPHSSALADLMIENISVGTVTSTEGDEDGTVFGFASVLNFTTYQDQPCIQALKKICLDKCPAANKKELEVVLSGKTNRPAGFYLHGRMVNMPLEIVQILHEQLVLDMDWAVKNAEGGEEMRKSLDFGAFVLLAPTYHASGVSYYKNFDDEIFANHAEFKFEMELPKLYGMEETPYCNVIVMTKTGHRDAMKSLADMVGGGGAEER